MDVHPAHLKRLTEVAGVQASDWLRGRELREDKRVPLSRLYDMLEYVASQRSTSDLGVELGFEASGPVFEPVEGICCKLDTLGDAIQCWVQNHPVVAGSQALAFDTFGDTAIMDISTLGRWREAHDHIVDLFMARQYELMRRAVGDVTPRLVQLTREENGSKRIHEEFFGCETEFTAPRNRLVFDADLLECAMQTEATGDETVEDALEELAGERRSVTSQDIVRKIRGVLAESATPQSMSLEDVADAFDVSARTLQRRMRATGETLRRVRDDVQKDQVRTYIQEGKPFDEIADMLGYSELSAFYRAFKRWFGVTPAEFRSCIRRKD